MVPGGFWIFRQSFVKGRVHEVHVFLIQLVTGQAQSLTKSLEMDDFPGTEEANDIIDVRVIRQTENIIIGNTSLLLCCDRVRTTFLFCS